MSGVKPNEDELKRFVTQIMCEVFGHTQGASKIYLKDNIAKIVSRELFNEKVAVERDYNIFNK